MTELISMSPIGFVSSPVRDRVDENWGAVLSRITLKPEYAAGIEGLDGFSHAIIVTYLHEARYDAVRDLRRRPRERNDMPEVGIFSQRAKDRPNPIGVTAVAIESVADGYLQVRGLDAIDGTPVLDIKPYYPQYDNVGSARVPTWVERLMEGYF